MTMTSYIRTESDEYEVCETKLDDFIAKDKLFLTRKDANEYLEKCGYNHNKNARSYAITAQRSPVYEKLLEILTHIDFDKSNIVMKDE